MFTHIVHISDIHIRTGDKEKCRYDEYMFVFKGLVDQIDVWLSEEKRIIVVITGDIFHHKSKIESVGIFLFQEMVSMLEKLVPVVIIRGNHDYCQENIETDAIDMIQALLHNRHAPNVRYLDQSGTYVIGNILFGVVTIQDVLQKGCATASLQVSELPSFPMPPPTNKHDISVALYHGTLNGCTLQNYTRSPSGVPIEWFHGYDVVMLGDVHLRQTCKNWGYAGSLIQQNFGEPPLEHGGLLWNIKTKEAVPFNVKSCVSYVPVRSLEHIASILRNPCCADLVKTRLANTMDAEDDESMMTMAEAYGKKIQVQAHGKNQVLLNNDQRPARPCPPRYDDKDAFDEFVDTTVGDRDVADNLRRWKHDPFDLCIPIYECMPAPLDHGARQRNKKISDLGCEYKDALSSYLTRQDPNIVFESLEWDWIMCYESGCRFDFKTTKGNLVAINARNGHGKSSFIDIVCIALFGTSINHLRHHASSIICLQTPSKASSKTTITFKLTDQDTLYELTRTFSKMKNNAKRLTSKAVLKRNGELMYSGKTAVDQWIGEKIGGLDEFVFTNILTQQGTESFFNMENHQQIDLLDRSANTNAQNQLHTIFKASVLAHLHIADGIDILRKNEDTIVENLASSRSNDETIIKEYEALRDKALRTESRGFVVPCKSSIELGRELDAIMDIETCDSYDHVQSLFDNVGAGEEIESDLTDMKNYANRLEFIEREIEQTNSESSTEINYRHELLTLARQIRDKGIDTDKCCDDDTIPDISQATLNEMQSALSKTMSCIPPEFHDMIAADGEFDEYNVVPHNPDCWACNARKDTNNFQAMIPLMKHCKVTHKMLRRHQESLDRQSDRDLVKRFNMLKEIERLADLSSKKEVIQSRIRYICKRLLERHDRIEKLRYWICVTSMKERESDYKKACGNIQNLKSARERRDQLVELASSLKLRIASIENAQAALVGYRIWLYQNRIIPNLIDAVNALIGMITTRDHPLELDASVQCDGNKLTVDWYINNGPQRPPIEKASGFQKFIAGLAIRIALTQQLGNATRSSHLFLDEGFVACDRAHLRRVPVFLSNLLDLYDSILVFTHLEDLKDAMDMQIYIQRNAETQLSFFCF